MKTAICTQCLSRNCLHLKPPPQLSERHADLLRLLAEGLGNQEIAERLFLRTGTVKVYLTRLFPRIGVTTRLQAGLWALNHAKLLEKTSDDATGI